VRLPKSGAAEWGGWRQWAFIATGLAAGFVSLAVPGDTRFASWAGAGMGGLVIVLLAAGGARASSDHSRWDAAEAAVSWLVPRAISRTLVNQGRLTASLIRWVLRRQPADTGPLFGYARPLWAATWAFVGLTVFEAVLVDGAVYIAAGDSPWLWGVLAFHVYCVVWLVAVYASAKVVPHQVADAHLILNDGCFAVATVPYTALQSAVLHKRPNFYRSGMKLDLTDRSMLVACSDANVRLVLEPATQITVNGVDWPVSTIDLSVDDPAAFVNAIRARIEGGRERPDTDIGSPAGPPRQRSQVRVPRSVQLALLCGPLLSMIDTSVVNVALVPIGRTFHASLPATQWTASAYLLTLGIGLSGTSFFSKRFGEARVYTTCLVAFVLSSLACALAPSLPLLIAARSLQGLAGAPMVPVAMGLTLGNQRSGSISPLAGMLLFVAPALGPSVGGGVIALGGWRWAFVINLPIGLYGAAVARRSAYLMRPANRKATFDPVGTGVLALGIGCILFGADRAGAGWRLTSAISVVAAGVVFLAGYALWARNRRHPALRLDVLKDRIRGSAILLGAGVSVVAFAAVFLIPVFLQSVQGYAPWEAGLALLPQGLMTGLATFAGEHTLPVLGLRKQLTLGFLLLAVSTACLLWVHADTSIVWSAMILTLRSTAMGLNIAAVLFALTSGLDGDAMTDASTLFNVTERLAASLGIAAILSLFEAESVRAGPITSLHITALVLVGLALALAVVSLTVTRPLRRKRPPDSELAPGRAEEFADTALRATGTART